MLIRRILRHNTIMPIALKFFPSLFTRVESGYISQKDPEFQLIQYLCSLEKTSLDIGVLWGGYTYELVKYSKDVICYEPNVYMCNHLEKVFDSSVKIKNVAVSDSSGTTMLRIPLNSPGNSTIENSNDLNNFKNVNDIQVKKMFIDAEQLDNVGLIKIDVEGHENAVLEGMVELLEKNKPVIIVESEERHCKNAISLVRDYFERNDYKMMFLRGTDLLDFKHFTMEYQRDVDRGTSLYINNFIGVHKSKINWLDKRLSAAPFKLQAN